MNETNACLIFTAIDHQPVTTPHSNISGIIAPLLAGPGIANRIFIPGMMGMGPPQLGPSHVMPPPGVHGFPIVPPNAHLNLAPSHVMMNPGNLVQQQQQQQQ